MKTLKISFLFAIISFFVVLSGEPAVAQCAMCRATIESSISDGSSSIGSGLNFGIMYLFCMPYLAFLVLAYFWYKSSKENDERRIKIPGYLKGKMS